MNMSGGGPLIHPRTSSVSGPVTDVDPGQISNRPRVDNLDAKTRAGLGLAQLVLGLIACATLLFFALAVFEESRDYTTSMVPADRVLTELAHQAPGLGAGPGAGNLVEFQKSVELARSLLQDAEAQHRDTRDFILKIGQLVLLTLFLPILTAILGYIFGTQQVPK